MCDPFAVARILHLISSNARRGAEVFAVELGEHLRSAGHEVRVVAIEPSATGETLPTEVAGLRRFDPRGLMAVARAARWADLVVGFGASSLLTGAAAARLAGTPFVYRNIGDPAVWGRVRGANLRIGLPLRSAATVVALFPAAAESLESYYRLDRSRIRQIPRGVPAGRFRPADPEERALARKRLGLDPTLSWLGYVGALSPEKDPELALGVLEQLDDSVGLVIAGDGPMRATLEQAAQPFGERVVMLGSVNDVTTVFSAIDTLVLTSRTEGIPGVVIEAGMSAVPTVATDVGGVAQVIDDGQTGRVVPLDDAAGFAAAVAEVLAQATTMGERAATKCNVEYSMATVGAAWEQVVIDSTAGR